MLLAILFPIHDIYNKNMARGTTNHLAQYNGKKVNKTQPIIVTPNLVFYFVFLRYFNQNRKNDESTNGKFTFHGNNNKNEPWADKQEQQKQ